MRIAFDLDGVLADLHGAFAEAAHRLFPEVDFAAIRSPEVGSSPPDADAPTAPKPSMPISRTNDIPLTSRQNEAVWRTLSGSIALTVAAVPTGMKAGVRISPRAVRMMPVRAVPSVR